MQMARSIDSNDIDLSLKGFDIGIKFDVFEENMKKIVELPVKYLDSVHGKAVELIEDVHAMLWATFPDGEVPNELHESFADPSNSSVTGSLPTSVETKLVGTNDEVSNRASLISVENGFTCSIDMDAHETESVLTENPENTSLKWDRVEANDLCLLPKDTLTTEVYDSTTSEEIILWNPDNSAKPPRVPESTTISEDDYVPHVLDTGKVAEKVGLDCSAYSETISHGSNADVAICVRNGQENMKNDKVEASYVYVRQNTSFKRMFMRNLSSKLRWSKKQTSVPQAVPATAQDGEDLGYQLVSSRDDLDDDWEIL